MARAKAGQITKTEAVRQALAQAGADAAAETVIQFVKSSFGLNLSRSHFFNIKSTLKASSGRKRGRPRKTVAATNGTPATAAPRKVAIRVVDLEAVKRLTSRYSAE